MNIVKGFCHLVNIRFFFKFYLLNVHYNDSQCDAHDLSCPVYFILFGTCGHERLF